MKLSFKILIVSVLFLFPFSITKMNAQNLDTNSIINWINFEISNIDGNINNFTNSKIEIVPELVLDTAESNETMELENPLDGGFIKLYRDQNNELRLVTVHETYTNAVNWTVDKHFYLSNNKIIYYFETKKYAVPTYSESSNTSYKIINEQVYFYENKGIRYAVKDAKGINENELAKIVEKKPAMMKKDFAVRGETVKTDLKKLMTTYNINADFKS